MASKNFGHSQLQVPYGDDSGERIQNNLNVNMGIAQQTRAQQTVPRLNGNMMQINNEKNGYQNNNNIRPGIRLLDQNEMIQPHQTQQVRISNNFLRKFSLAHH